MPANYSFPVKKLKFTILILRIIDDQIKKKEKTSVAKRRSPISHTISCSERRRGKFVFTLPRAGLINAASYFKLRHGIEPYIRSRVNEISRSCSRTSIIDTSGRGKRRAKAEDGILENIAQVTGKVASLPPSTRIKRGETGSRSDGW